MPTNLPLTQSIVDGCQLIGIQELALRLHRAEATVRTQVTREPGKLPPRFFIPGSNQVVWMLSVVCDWMIQQQSTTLAISEPSISSQKPNAKRRGAPNAHEKLAARNAGKTVAEYRVAQMAGDQS
jgi:hypothetical protein